MEKEISEIIKVRTLDLLERIKVALERVDDVTLSKPDDNWPIWKQFYHLLYWLDYWFVDPNNFSVPSFHDPSYIVAEKECSTNLSKEDLLKYYTQIKNRIETFLNTLTSAQLFEELQIRQKRKIRIDIIIGQFFHVNHHLGAILQAIK